MSADFIRRTNEQYAAWCATYYKPDALDASGMPTLHGLWAWQEQERRVMEERERLMRLLWNWRHAGYSSARDTETDTALGDWRPGVSGPNGPVEPDTTARIEA